MEAGGDGVDIWEKLSGFIFLCNTITKPECYRYRVFGLPAGRKDVLEKINPGTYLFLFDTDVKLLYGIYMATSTGKLKIEPLAFGQKFPAQVKFKIYKECLPLPENCLKHAIQDNYQKGSKKFNPELNIRQVKSLIELFRPLNVLPTAPTHPFMEKPMNTVYHHVSGSLLSQDAFLSKMSPNQVPRLLNYKHVNELEKPSGCAYPVHNFMPCSAAAQHVPSQASMNKLYYPASTLTLEGTYTPGMGSGHTQPVPDPQYSHQTILNSQPEFHSSPVNHGRGHAQTLQDFQHAPCSIAHPQTEFHSSLMTTGSSHTQPLQDPQYQSIPNPRSLQDPQYPYQSIPNPPSLLDPQYPYRSIPNPPHDFHSAVTNAGSSHPQLSWGPRYTHQNILNLQPNTYSTMANTVAGYAESLPVPQHTYPNAQNPQPDFSSSLMNMGHTNVTMQSHSVSSFYHPYISQEVVHSMYSSQGSGAVQGEVPSGQQTGMGSVCYESSLQTEEYFYTREC